MPARKRTTKTQPKTSEPEFNAADANIVDPQEPEGMHDEGREELEREASKVRSGNALDDLRDKRNEAAHAGDAAATAHLDNLVREAEAAQRERDERNNAA